jgi:hypothetical protein
MSLLAGPIKQFYPAHSSPAASAALIGSPRSTSVLAQAQVDLLPSWNDGTSKRAIIDFVGRVTQQGGSDFV